MQCPRCHKNGSRVIDSRPTNDGKVIRRRRECENCGYRYTTFERVEETPLLVIKRNGNREEFNRKKILNGVIRSAEKRPVSMDEMTNLVDRVENKLRSLGENEVSSQLIGKYIMEELESVDEISYIRFASVYRQFKDMTVFYNEMTNVMKRDKRKHHDDTDGDQPDGK